MWETLVIILAGFGAGVVNSIAGGGTFLTFPALVWAGVPPIAANASSTLAALPGYASAAFGFREDITRIEPAQLIRASVAALAGGLAGGLLLLVSNEALFALVIPFLLLIATLIFTFQAGLLTSIRKHGISILPFGVVGIVVVSTYGGYFNGGLGIILLALFAMWGMSDLSQMNGLKCLLSMLISAISAVAFAAAGLIHWPEVLIMGAATITGGYAGARVSRVVPPRLIRLLIAAIGFALAAIFFARL